MSHETFQDFYLLHYFWFSFQNHEFFSVWFPNFRDSPCPSPQPCEVHIQTTELLWSFSTNPDRFLLLVLFQGMVIYQWVILQGDY